MKIDFRLILKVGVIHLRFLQITFFI